jgi:hypothetical protein
LQRPQLFWRYGAANATQILGQGNDGPPENPQADRPASNQLVIHQLSVVDGQMMYYQNAPKADVLSPLQDFSFELSDVQLKMQNLIVPFDRPAVTKFDLMARFFKEGLPISGSRVTSSGWVDWDRKDMEAEMAIIDLDGKAGLHAKAISRANDLEIKGKVDMKDFLTELGGQSEGAADLEGFLLGTLASSGLDIAANFSFQTRMDDFQIDNIKFSGSVESVAEKVSAAR